MAEAVLGVGNTTPRPTMLLLATHRSLVLSAKVSLLPSNRTRKRGVSARRFSFV